MKNKKLLAPLFLTFLFFIFLFSCNKEDEVKIILDKDKTQNVINKFALNGVNGKIIDNNVIVILPFGSDLSNLTPEISLINNDITIFPNKDTAKDFSTSESIPVEYIVTFKDKSTKIFKVFVFIEVPNKSIQNIIKKFTLKGVDGEFIDDNIVVVLPFGTDLRSLTPEISLLNNDITIFPSIENAQDFTNSVEYIVTFKGGATRKFNVSVLIQSKPLSSEKSIHSFVINGKQGRIDPWLGTITVSLPFGTDLSILSPPTTLISDFASISPAENVSIDIYNNPVTSSDTAQIRKIQMYKVTAQDGTTKNYFVIISVKGPSSSKEIYNLSIPGQGIIYISDFNSPTNKIIYIYPPTSSFSLSSVPVSFSLSEFATSSPISGSNQNFLYMDFSNGGVKYKVTAEDGTSIDYRINIIIVN